MVYAFTYSRIRDNIPTAIVRSVWLFTATYNFNLIVKHIAGTDNVYDVQTVTPS